MKKLAASVALSLLASLIVLPVIRSVNNSTRVHPLAAEGSPSPVPLPKPPGALELA